MPEPMLTVSIVKEACEKADRACIVGVALDAGRTVTDFATWGREAEDKVYADGLADMIRKGLGYLPAPPFEDYKLQAAHLKVLYDAVTVESLALRGNYDVRLQVAALDRIFAAAHKVPNTFGPPTFGVYKASGPGPNLTFKVERAVAGGTIEHLLKSVGGTLSKADLVRLTEWIDNEPIPGDVWRDDFCEVLVLRNSDI